MKSLLVTIMLASLFACQPKTDVNVTDNKEKESIEISSSAFGNFGGKTVQLYTLKNNNGMVVKVTNYGGIITSIMVPDKNGKMEDVALGFDDLDSYLGKHPYFGAIIGRYGNRIAGGKFSLDGNQYTLATNNGKNALHGGEEGFDKRLWKSKTITDGISLSRISPDMEEGFPGNLNATVEYKLTDDNEIEISYLATTDKPTICNLTNHSYFNLGGEGDSSIIDHLLTLNADDYNPVNEGLIPIGIAPVEGTPFDFTSSKKIGDGIDADFDQIKIGGGYDHNYVLRNKDGKLALAATVTEPISGRIMEVYTTEPGVQFYTGNFLDGTITGKSGRAYAYRSALCLETQHFPDSPNQAQFPSTALMPGETYKSKTTYKFSVMK